MIRSALVLSLFASLAACASGGGATTCQSDADCHGAETCESGRCAPRCTADTQCGRGERCDASGACVERITCEADSDCASGQRCGSAGHCLTSSACDADADCPMGYMCDAGACEKSGLACIDNEPPSCPEGQVCSVEKVCLDKGRCVTSEDCAPNHSCSLNYACVPDKSCSSGCATGEVCSFTGGCIPAGSCAVDSDCQQHSEVEICAANYECALGLHCGHVRFSPMRTPSNVLIVIDKSGSMKSNWGDGPTRWEMATETIARVVESYQHQLNFGLMIYPGGSDEEQLCAPGELVLPMGEATPERVRSEMWSRTPWGGTPTRATLQEVLDDTAAFGLDDPTSTNAILLVTDGGANCDTCAWCVAPEDEEAVNPVVAGLAQRDPPIATYVIGFHMFWEETNLALNCHAVAGGTARGGCVRGEDCHDTTDPCYRRVDYTPGEPDYGASQLETTMGGIIWTASSCSFVLPHDPPDAERMFVYADDGTTLTEVWRDPWRNDGWDYSPEGRVLSVFGTACEPFSWRRADLVVIFGCTKP